jgi:hypothetical protein
MNHSDDKRYSATRVRVLEKRTLIDALNAAENEGWKTLPPIFPPKREQRALPPRYPRMQQFFRSRWTALRAGFGRFRNPD